MASEKKHWVEELFAPRFTVQDLLHETFEPDLLLSEKLAKERAKTVEGIYQTELKKLQEEEKRKQKECLSRLIVQDYESSAQETPATTQGGKCASCHRPNGTASIVGDSSSCIWNEHELNLLRREMKKKDAEGTQLKLHLNACRLELSELKAKQKETEQELEALRAELAASKRANECKSVLLKQMQTNDTKKDAELQFVKKDLHEHRAKLSNITNSLGKAREEIQDLQLQNKDLEEEFNTLKQQQSLKNILAMEKMKLKFSGEVNKLRGEIESIRAETKNPQLAKYSSFLK
ncbi:coiled-coil domain-containing protein 160 [Hyperolius riggenbachi]|uniref:coiled-coil domain-containing protein 160 n=1 Tax=Hyperolius riggenbachi TaxID=752182 RepID=UPI0035A350C6